MIRNFEEYTSELTEDEANYIMPKLLKILILRIGKENAITNRSIINYFKAYPILKQDKMDPGLSWTIKTSEPRIRHMIHILRVSDTIPFLVASSQGYYISNDKQEIEDYMQSIDDRLRSIYQIRRALKRQIREWGKPTEAIQGQLIF